MVAIVVFVNKSKMCVFSCNFFVLLCLMVNTEGMYLMYQCRSEPNCGSSCTARHKPSVLLTRLSQP